MNYLLIGLAVLGCFHWSAGLIIFAVWLIARIVRGREIALPRAWGAWLLAGFALTISAGFATRPSGLQWAGLLQYFSFACGVIVVQDRVRERPRGMDVVWWSLLAIGCFQSAVWAWNFLESYSNWWSIRVHGLPWFPFRHRLFGSHGSTQAATWLGAILLIGALWALPRITKSTARRVLFVVLVIESVLLGLTDSRLALGGLLLVLLAVTWREGMNRTLSTVTLVPVGTWVFRDLVHPSRVVTGGAIGQGWVFLLAWISVLGVALALRKWWPIQSLGKLLRILGGWFWLLFPLWILGVLVFGSAEFVEHMSTGRRAFWLVGLRILEQHPIVGVGPWGFVWEYAKGVDWIFDFLAMHPHNVALDVLTSGGLLLGAAVLWICASSFDWTQVRWVSWRMPLVLGLFLAFSMSFDSPFSSPQVMTTSMICLGFGLSSRSEGLKWEPPRSIVLAPLLLLVPVAYLVDAQVGKQHLIEAGALIREGRIESGAHLILEAPTQTDDPQWRRNTLMARSALYSSRPESALVYAPLWDSMVVLEPGFRPNRVHAAWMWWRVTGRPEDRASFDVELANLTRNTKPLVCEGEPPMWWGASYPSDSVAFWERRLDSSHVRGDAARVRWISAWLAAREPGRRVRESGGGIPRIPAGAEQQLYGSDGTGWVL